ncbi:hypothetical protein AGMMS50225_27870 [Betaproteobacteria bacterium]|nr:hypothetical protein AGMMS50225_27870 [Betaproteobacteria bacterium]
MNLTNSHITTHYAGALLATHRPALPGSEGSQVVSDSNSSTGQTG